MKLCTRGGQSSQVIYKMYIVPPVQGQALPAFSGLTFSAPHLQSAPQVHTFAATNVGATGREEVLVSGNSIEKTR